MENALFPPLRSLIQAFILRIRSCAVSLLPCPGMSFGENSVPLNLTHLFHQFKVMEMGAERAGFRVLFPNLGGFCTQSSTTSTGMLHMGCGQRDTQPQDALPTSQINALITGPAN